MNTISGTAVKQKKVLLVDDDQFLVGLYKKTAELYPIELVAAVSGEEALDFLRAGFVPDNILLDITMPGMNGVEVLAKIREEKLASEADITILSNVHQAEHEEDFKRLGIQRFVPKSFLLPSQVLEHLVQGFGTDWSQAGPM